ncbi:hypothetical protein TNCV_3640061 [Trichonephila clavipes]|nr:hypothetical protein TNCV_3640061 [Trichonephila clavipes]
MAEKPTERYTRLNFQKFSEANGWTEGVKACQLAASLRGEAAEELQTLPDRYFVDRLKDGEIQRAIRMADVHDPKSALLYALKLDATNEARSRDHHSI